MVTMFDIGQKLLEIYTQLGGLALLGFILGRLLPPRIPMYVGQFLFWIGVPVSVFAFVRRTDLSGSIWLAPAIAWGAILLGGALGWLWLQVRPRWQPPNAVKSAPMYTVDTPSQGSFLLAAMVGNTGYIGYPVTLTLVGEKYFGWALFYDLFGTVIGAYGLGVAIAARFGEGDKNPWQVAAATVRNPTLFALALGLLVRSQPFPAAIESGLQTFAWGSISGALVLLGMRLSRLRSWSSLKPAAVSLGIKMLVVPAIVGALLTGFGLRGMPQLVMVLQVAMPPAFANLVLAETYQLDRDLTVTALAVGSVGFLVTLPLWLLLFGR
ncbi:AEC family transporter [Oxynema sp. CENA135]|uniref:AEC family transporter n=1 Tax=Oxynema sp. CENA135 TaxID=984206 RepID=UPI00351C2975